MKSCLLSYYVFLHGLIVSSACYNLKRFPFYFPFRDSFHHVFNSQCKKLVLHDFPPIEYPVSEILIVTEVNWEASFVG